MNERQPQPELTPENTTHLPDTKSESDIETEKMVQATKIKTIFSDPKVLEAIADKLLSDGTISGFNIEQVVGGYIYDGAKTEEVQYALEILLASDTDQETKKKIKSSLIEKIGEKWDAPMIEESTVEINESLLNFIKRAEIEHKRFTRERRMRYSVSLTALLSIAGIIGTITDRYVGKQIDKAAIVERDKAYKKVIQLEKEVEEQIDDLNWKMSHGEAPNMLPNDMAADAAYIETEKILRTVRDLELEMRRLVEADEKK